MSPLTNAPVATAGHSHSTADRHCIPVRTKNWEAEINLLNGGNLWRLKHRSSGLDILRSPKNDSEYRRQPEAWGIPVLFPPNRISGGRFTWRNREYFFPVNEPARNNHIHGILLNRPWTLARLQQNEDEAEIELCATHTTDSDSYAGYPHAFELRLIYRFNSTGVIQTARLLNQSRDPMPFGLGFHSSFRLPFGQKAPSPASPCRVHVTAPNGRWEIDQESCVPSSTLLPWSSDESWNQIRGRDIIHQAVSLHCPAGTNTLRSGNSFRGAILYSPVDRARLIYEVDDHFQHWCLWNGGGQRGFICVEPMTWMVNAPHIALPVEITGLRELAPAATWQAGCRLQLELDA